MKTNSLLTIEEVIDNIKGEKLHPRRAELLGLALMVQESQESQEKLNRQNSVTSPIKWARRLIKSMGISPTDNK